MSAVSLPIKALLHSFVFGVIDSFNLNRFFRAAVSNPTTFLPFGKLTVLHLTILVMFPAVTYVTDVIAQHSPLPPSTAFQCAIFLIRTILLAVPMLMLSLCCGTVWCRNVYDSVAPPAKRPALFFEDFVMVLVGATIPLFLPLPVKIIAALIGAPWLNTCVVFVFGVLSHSLYAFNYRLSSMHLTAQALVDLLEKRAMYLFGFALVAHIVVTYVLECIPVMSGLEGLVVGFGLSSIILPVQVVVSCDIDLKGNDLAHVQLPVLRLNYHAVDYVFRLLERQKKMDRAK